MSTAPADACLNSGSRGPFGSCSLGLVARKLQVTRNDRILVMRTGLAGVPSVVEKPGALTGMPRYAKIPQRSRSLHQDTIRFLS